VAELGALSLKIEAIGDKQVLAALNAIESKARVVDKSVTDAVAALKQLGIAAKAVGSQVAVASADVEKATGLIAKMGLTAKVVSKENIEAAKVEGNANRVRARGFQEYLGLLTTGARLEGSRADSIRQLVSLESALQKQLQQTNLTFQQRVRLGETLGRVQAGIASGIEQTTVVAQRSTAVQKAQVSGFTVLGQTATTTGGRLSAFSTRSIGALNAASFALSSLAAGGQASFRSLASAAAGFFSFFGPGGAIAAIAITAGLAISDFFSRTRREIEETKEKAKEALRDLKASIESDRRQGDQEGLIERVRQATLNLAESEEELVRVRQRLLPIDAKLEQVRKLSSVAAALLRRNEAEEIKDLRVRRAELEALIPLHRQEIDLAGKAALNIREPAVPRGPGEVKVTAKGPKSPEDAEKERRKAIADEINALASLSQSRGLTGVEVVRLTALERQLTAELRAGLATKEREAEIWDQIGKARATGTRAIPPIGVQDLVSDRPQAARTLTLPPSLQAQLDPAKIQADTWTLRWPGVSPPSISTRRKRR
jgi:hypothetical protein